MNFLGFGQSADIDISFDGAETRKLAEMKTEDGKKEKYLLYYDGETVSGKVNVTLKRPGSKLEHQGIKIELIGQIELFYDRGNHQEFTSLVKELARPGDLIQNTFYPFEFLNVEKPYEVYVGANVRLRYFLRVTIIRRLSDIVKEIDICVHTLSSYPEMNNPIKMEVGIEDCLHIEFEYNKSKYHLKDVIVGKIYFLLVRIKIKHMEIAIIKRETTGSGPNTFTENETIAKYEIMDGAPVKGESIPIRVFLAGYDLTPTMRDINKKFSVRYFLNLVLMDTEDRRYFKQQDITLWRKADKNRKAAITSTANPHVPTHLVGLDGEIMPKHIDDNQDDKYNHQHQSQQQQQPDQYHSQINYNNQQQQTNDNKIVSNENYGNHANINDPAMGLFTQESPLEAPELNPLLKPEEDVHISNNSTAISKATTRAITKTAIQNRHDVQITNNNDNNSTNTNNINNNSSVNDVNEKLRRVSLHRDAGDGASSQSIETDRNETSEKSMTSSSSVTIFDDNTTSTATATTEVKNDNNIKDDDVNNKISRDVPVAAPRIASEKSKIAEAIE